MMQDPQDEERDKQGRIIRRPVFKYDPWRKQLDKNIPKLGPNDVLEDDGFVPPDPSPAEIEEIKKFDTLKKVVNLFDKIPHPLVPKEMLHKMLDIHAEGPADSFRDVPDEKKAKLLDFVARLRGNA